VNHVIVIDEWPIDDDQRVAVAIICFNGRWRIDVRRWIRLEDGSEYAGKGIGLPLQYLARLHDAMAKAHAGAVARDLMPSSRTSSAVDEDLE
jgi:hypothetical protein